MTNGVNSVNNSYNRVDCTVEKVTRHTGNERTDTKKKTENIDVKGKTNLQHEDDVNAIAKNADDNSTRKIKEALDQANQKARFHKTACEFAYDETTNRISITIRDKETDEIIRQVPAEETLEMISKLWEQAGILVDEKR